MTKAEKQRIFDKFSNGKLGLRPEYLIKEQEKAERRAEKAAQKRMDKSNELLQKQLDENKALKEENAALKARILELEQEAGAMLEKLEKANADKSALEEKFRRAVDWIRKHKEEKVQEVQAQEEKAQEVQNDIPEAPEHPINAKMLQALVSKGHIAKKDALSIAKILSISMPALSAVGNFEMRCRSLPKLRRMVADIKKDSAWYSPDFDEMMTFEAELDSIEARYLNYLRK